MSVLTIRDLIPPARFDEPTPLAWVEARVEESTAATGEAWVEMATITLDPVEPDPTDPLTRNVTIENATEGRWYRVVFVDASGDEALPSQPLHNEATAAVYATVDELAHNLKIRNPSALEERAMQRALETAALEIDSEIDRTADNPLTGRELALAAAVNLDRAAEHWPQVAYAFGLIGIGSEVGPTRIARNTWERHAHTLAPLKEQHGFA